MVLNRVYDFAPGSTGSQGFLFGLGTPPTFSQIFTGTPLYYHGSIIQVQEITTIETSVIDPLVVDVDYGWFAPRQYLGTWQVSQSDTSVIDDGSGYGYITNEISKLIRRTYYTIVHNPNTPITQGDTFQVIQCNLELYNVVVNVPPLGTIGVLRPFEKTPLLGGRQTRKPATLADTDYNVQIPGLGLFLRPGVEVIRCTQQIAIVNDIYIDDPIQDPIVCELSSPDCDVEFEGFLNESGDVPWAFHFATLGQCELQYPGNCQEFTFTCTNGQTRTYYAVPAP